MLLFLELFPVSQRLLFCVPTGLITFYLVSMLRCLLPVTRLSASGKQSPTSITVKSIKQVIIFSAIHREKGIFSLLYPLLWVAIILLILPRKRRPQNPPYVLRLCDETTHWSMIQITSSFFHNS